MFKVIALVIVAAIAALLAFAATRPDTFRVERRTTIQASPAKIYPLIEDFHQWAVWSPYEKLDPAMNRSYSGAARGKGAAYAWQSDGKAGAGKMLVTEATAPSAVVIQLDFVKPFEGHNIAEFTLKPEGSATQVTWAMHGPA